MAASSAETFSAYSASSLALKVVNKFLILLINPESAWISEELS